MIGGTLGRIRTSIPCLLGAVTLPVCLPGCNLVENTGIEPVVPEGGGFTVHCITIDASSPKLGGLDENRTRPIPVTGGYSNQ